MTTITFDTLKFVERLRAAGVPDGQAKAEAEALAEALSSGAQELATKGDIREMRQEMVTLKAEVMGELKLNRWMTGLLLAGVMSLILKAFF
ncbi:MAG: hypothetical protein H7841_11175 [Magnetospirillum sp. WYHS-4]